MYVAFFLPHPPHPGYARPERNAVYKARPKAWMRLIEPICYSALNSPLIEAGDL